ncbi:probable ATP-dependent RNA helicase DDX10 [Anopheles ziemanni]|uniref:probable ATP-dependent RNA helicase DDX10 n=1 Tax=Anopheles coustani TaxID=139045 RepID=UPI0026588DDB|nr:probable ATP-dependent RNA helicase DDX10 [Anopheles coustani]XP_058176901.1 probable ATP-dependent RNA helicase DDX10 [Anopheles ziemanni]
MNKGRYVNFARKTKNRGRSVAQASKTGKNSEYFDKNANNHDEAGQTSRGQVMRSTLKFSVKEEEAEIKSLLQLYQNNVNPEEVTTFKSFPLSKKTLTGLSEAGYIKPTTIQRNCILPGLRGEDILAAAKTGSGKTLAFLIPIIERLYTLKWTRLDGLGALIITPTRELALQIFETMAQIGSHHDITTGLIIGGQNLKHERNLLHNLNVMISTPGRLLQHMDQNPLFDATNLKVLVLDEADRCLDLGFKSAMDAILENLPQIRQTLLFSATQTKSVCDLARVNLKDPRCIAPHEHEAIATPVKLQQSYVTVELHEKLTVLWSFLRTHPKQKIIVFFATCKQVKYFYQVLKKLRPASLLLPLYGGMNQEKRNKIYSEFCGKNSNVCLLATDVASRGLDFPRVNWVVQMDCPEDVTQYIHRAGRTARLNASGENLLVLIPHEVPVMLESLAIEKIPIKQIKIDDRQLFSPLVKIQSLLAQSPELKECAKRAFTAYVKSVALMKNREIFQLEKLKLDEYARSLGLNVTPRVRFLNRAMMKNKLAPSAKQNSVSKTTNIHIDCGDSVEEQSDEEEFLKIKRMDHDSNQADDSIDQQNCTVSMSVEPASTAKKRISKAKMVKKSFVVSKHTLFNADGMPVSEGEPESATERYDIEKARLLLQNQDAADKERYKSLKKAKRNAQKEKERKRKADQDREEDLNEDFSSDENVNLDWLPDPEKIYGEIDTQKDESAIGACSEKEKSTDSHPTKKKRILLQKAKDLTLNEAEELVMKLLV